jgi:chemotaxis protein CheX
MKVEFVNPFLTATAETFRTMLNVTIQVGQPALKNDAVHTYDISGVIGLTGDAQGVIAMSFPGKVAMQVVSDLIGSPITEIGPDLTDGIGEIVNIVAGNAKQYLTDFNLSISLPNVVIGEGHRIAVPTGVPTIVVPIAGGPGEFAMEIALRTK